MSRVAVVGAGISGLATAWLLSRRHDVLLLEREARLGGHTHTHHVDTPDGRLALDTGFLVHNNRTYPRLVRLFEELQVACLDSDMSFGVTCPRTGFEYSTRSLNGLFADRRNVIRPAHYGLLRDILRFNRKARALIARASVEESGRAQDTGDGGERLTLGEFLDAHQFRGEFVDRYLLPLASAIWSASLESLRDFPALTLVRFFHQHGMITVLDHPTWRIVKGGSSMYVKALLDVPRLDVWTESAPASVLRGPESVQITFANRPAVSVDHVVFACHASEVLPVLGDASPDERAILSAFGTSTNIAVLHTAEGWLPTRPAARASWNYLIGAATGLATVTYHLNRLQRLDARRDYCVTLNPPTPIEPSQVLARMTYKHPLYTRAAVAAQSQWSAISGQHRTHYCGAYWFYGFHEDGLRSATRVASALGVSW